MAYYRSMALTIFTIGHSTHPIDEFIEMLKAHNIELVADVRTIAKSRHNPQFNEKELEASLAKAGIAYQRLEKLGGLRHTTKNSINKGWHNPSFRGYADYMQTADFWSGIDKLLEVARKNRTAIMCAEAVPWRCHRSLIGDALLLKDVHAEDIIGTAVKPHKLTPFAKINGNTITYPSAD